MNFPRTWLSLMAIAVGVALPAPAGAQADAGPMAVTLEYSAVGSCPDANHFKALVIERIGVDAFVANAPRHVILLISSNGSTFEGNIEWLDAKGNWVGERTFPAHSHDCEDLVRAMAFTLALQLQLSAVTDAPTVEATPAEPVAPTTTAPTASAPPPPNVPAIETRHPVPKPQESAIHRRGPRLAIGAGTWLGFGMASSPVPFARVFGDAVWPHASLELATELGLPATVRRSDGAGFSQQLLLGSVAACASLKAWSGCLLTKVGTVRIAGKDIDSPSAAVGTVFETGLRVKALQQIFHHAYVSVYTDALARPVLWEVTLDHSVVWRSPRFAGAIGVDASLWFD